MGIRHRKMGKTGHGRVSHTVIMRTYGDCLYWHRVSRRLSQRELCARTGNKISQQAIGCLEKGINEPLWVTACLLADALGLSLDAFRVDRPGPTTFQPTAKPTDMGEPLQEPQGEAR